MVRIHVFGQGGESHHLQWELASYVKDIPRQPEPHTQCPWESSSSNGLDQAGTDFQSHREISGDTLVFLCRRVSTIVSTITLGSGREQPQWKLASPATARVSRG